MKYIIINPAMEAEIKDHTEDTLADLQQAVGGYIETIPSRLPYPLIIVGDEEALLKDSPEINAVGTALYGGPICGSIVITAQGYTEDGDPDLVGLTDEQANEVKEILEDLIWFARIKFIGGEKRV